MSVTFTIEQHETDITGYGVESWIDGEYRVVETYSTYDAAVAVASKMDGWMHDVFVRPVTMWDALGMPEVNMSNSNANALLRAAGVDTEFGLAGSMDAAELADRLLLVSAVADPGSDTIVVGGDESATFYDCGRPAGYLDSRAAAVRELCEQAAAFGRWVQWA